MTMIGGDGDDDAFEYEDCPWTEDDPDACTFCSGAQCAKCGAGMCGFREHPCEHDSLERHEKHNRFFEGNEH